MSEDEVRRAQILIEFAEPYRLPTEALIAYLQRPLLEAIGEITIIKRRVEQAFGRRASAS